MLRVLHAVVIGDARDDELPFDPVRAFAEADRVGAADVAAVVRVLFEEEDPDIESVADVADAVALRWAADAYRAAEPHTAAFVSWLHDPDPAVAALAAALVVWFSNAPGLAEALAEAGGPGHGRWGRRGRRWWWRRAGVGESRAGAPGRAARQP
ncbi:hypothetical protein ABT147_31475 [Streptomyces sp. NPDC001868]|uniref:hypothetical protein n=1 Tax=Streptomyces sp. NPDC001868 TaxID=3154401 RepID=UPI00331C53E2